MASWPHSKSTLQIRLCIYIPFCWNRPNCSLLLQTPWFFYLFNNLSQQRFPRQIYYTCKNQNIPSRQNMHLMKFSPHFPTHHSINKTHFILLDNLHLSQLNTTTSQIFSLQKWLQRLETLCRFSLRRCSEVWRKIVSSKEEKKSSALVSPSILTIFNFCSRRTM